MGDEKLLREADALKGEDRADAVAEILRRGKVYIPPETDDGKIVESPFKKPMFARSGDIKAVNHEWKMERKLDGWRCLSYVTDDGVLLFTRTGKPLTSVPYINEALAGLPVGTILDGEIVDLAADDGKEWNRTQTICSRKAQHVPSDDDPALTYVVFDLPSHGGMQVLRRAHLEGLFLGHGELEKDGYVWLIEQRELSEDHYNALVDAGAEGVVLKHDHTPYVWGQRSKGWLKVKPTLECDAEIIGFYEAEPGSKYDGEAVGGILFRLDNGVEGRASGMNDQLRKNMFWHPNRFTGRIVELHYGGINEDTGALRFPRFRRLRAAADKEVL